MMRNILTGVLMVFVGTLCCFGQVKRHGKTAVYSKKKTVIIGIPSGYVSECGGPPIPDPPYGFEQHDAMPTFPASEGDLKTYIQNHLTYGKRYDEITGKVIVRIFIGIDGTILDATIVRGIHPAMDSAVLLMVHQMPCWVPAPNQQKPVVYTFPVSFMW